LGLDLVSDWQVVTHRLTYLCDFRL